MIFFVASLLLVVNSETMRKLPKESKKDKAKIGRVKVKRERPEALMAVNSREEESL